MKINELMNREPAIGDIVAIEAGDTLIEAIVEDVTEDGVVIQLDDTARKILDEGFFDRIKNVAAKTRAAVDNSVAKQTLESLGYIIGIANATEDYDTGFALIKKALTDSEFFTLNKAIHLAKASSEITSRAYLSKGIDQAKKDYGMLEETVLLRVVKLKFTKVVQGMNYLESTAVNPEDKPTFRTTTRFGDLDEAKYQGREVPLGKPMKGDVKKSKVYVKGPKGNVVKVNFGDKNMRIKKSNPKRRKSFRARHNCANPGPRWKARYWSCRAW